MAATRNGRYTLGAQAAQIDNIAESVKRIETTLNAHMAEEREFLERMRTEIADLHAQSEAAITSVRERVIGLEHDARIANRIQMTFTAIGSVIAGLVGAVYQPK